MKKQEIKKWQYILDSDEMDTVHKALIYAKHRITKHPNCGAKVISLEKVEAILKEFDCKFEWEFV